jgi:hypothetical protein
MAERIKTSINQVIAHPSDDPRDYEPDDGEKLVRKWRPTIKDDSNWVSR